MHRLYEFKCFYYILTLFLWTRNLMTVTMQSKEISLRTLTIQTALILNMNSRFQDELILHVIYKFLDRTAFASELHDSEFLKLGVHVQNQCGL